VKGPGRSTPHLRQIDFDWNQRRISAARLC
jgi:hypothetical protein